MKQKKSQKNPTVPVKPTPEEIAAAAYHLYVDGGYQDGRDQEHWLRAEQLLTKKLRSASQAQAAPAPATNAGQGVEIRTKTATSKSAPIRLPWNPEPVARPTARASVSRPA